MKTIELGQSGIKVSPICLGLMLFGSTVDEKQSFRILDQFAEAGGNFVDTANNYAFWVDGCSGNESEELLGKWLKSRKNRSKIVVATKVGAKPKRPGDGLDNIEGLSARSIRKAVEDSLKRLQTDYIDLYYTHIPDRNVSQEEILETMNELIRQGKIRTMGASNRNSWEMAQADKIASSTGLQSYCALQNKYTYFQPRKGTIFLDGLNKIISEEMIDCNNELRNFQLLAYTPLLGGIYSRDDKEIPREYDTESNTRRLKILQKISADTGYTANQIVLAWMRNSKPSILPITAVSQERQLTENLVAVDINLSEEHMNQLNTSF